MFHKTWQQYISSSVTDGIGRQINFITVYILRYNFIVQTYSVFLQIILCLFCQILEVTFDGTSGLLKRINNKASDVETKISQQLMFYTGFKGNNSGAQFTASGAYIFRPNEANPIPLNKTATITVYQVLAVLNLSRDSFIRPTNLLKKM